MHIHHDHLDTASQKKKWKNLENSSMGFGKIKSKKEVILEAQRDKKKVHFATLMDKSHLKNAELELNLHHCERRLWSLCSVH